MISSHGRIRVSYGRVLTLNDILRFVFNLNDTDLAIMNLILKNKEITVDELVKTLRYNRSSISRSLIKLLNLGLIERGRVHVEKKVGRPMYVYKTKSPSEIREVLRLRVKMCAEAALKLIDELLG